MQTIDEFRRSDVGDLSNDHEDRPSDVNKYFVSRANPDPTSAQWHRW
jgi:hypothetical protein